MFGRNSNVVWFLCIGIFTLFIGCSIEQRHSALTFFFDGVDKSVFFNDYLSKDSLSKESVAKREQLLARIRPEQVVHKPFKEKKCEQCHTPDKHLRKPLPTLCFQCHNDFSASNAFVHGPVASGNCLKCHNQHSSKYPKLLIRPGQQLCTYCHSPSLVFKAKYHRDIEDAACILCHNPHGGKNRFMLKDAVASNMNSFVMNTIGGRHLYGQVFSKTPGDIVTHSEIAVVDDQGDNIFSVHPDFTGRFTLSNLHPDANYTFRLKDLPDDAKINIMNLDGEVLYVIERNRKGKYIFDKEAYEAAHEKINAINPLASPFSKDASALSLLATNSAVIAPSDSNASKSVQEKPADNGGIKSLEEITRAVVVKDTVAKPPAIAGQKVTVSETRGRIQVRELPPAPAAERNAPAKIIKKPSAVKEKKTDTISVSSKGNMVARELPQESVPAPSQQRDHRTFRPIKAGDEHTTLEQLARQISAYYGGNIVCMLNDSSELMGVGSVNDHGNFLINGYLPYYYIDLREDDRKVILKVVFVNEQMQVTGLVNKRYRDGQIVYIADPDYSSLKIVEAGNAGDRPFTSIVFDPDKADITASGRLELDKLAEYLIKNPGGKAEIVAYTGAKSARTFIKLSADRVKNVIRYLVSQGVRKDKMIGKGYGKDADGSSEGKSKADRQRQNKKIDVFIR